jgi:hypothetical protein
MILTLEYRVDEPSHGSYDADLKVRPPNRREVLEDDFDHPSGMPVGQSWASPRIESNAQIGAHRSRDRDQGPRLGWAYPDSIRP